MNFIVVPRTLNTTVLLKIYTSLNKIPSLWAACYSIDIPTSLWTDAVKILYI